MTAAAITYTPMTTIKLSGSLAKKFGRIHCRQLESGSIWEIFRALKATLRGFEDEIKRLDRLGVQFAVFRNRKNVNAEDFSLAGTREARIVPVVNGSKRAGALQTIVGVVLIIAASIALPGLGAAFAAGAGGWGTVASFGAALAIGGIIQMISPQPKGITQSASSENLPSYAFGSAKNTTASGNPVPICIGERRWGGAIISASILAEDKA